MKKIALLAMGLLSASAFAATENTTQTTIDSAANAPTINEGYRLSLKRGTVDAKSRVKTSGTVTGFGKFSQTNKNTSQIDETYFLSAGYQKIKLNKIGYMGEVSMGRYTSEGDTLTETGIEGAATLGLRPDAYAFAGIKISNLETNGDSFARELVNDFDLGRGYFVGAGYKVNKDISLEAKYFVTNYSGATLDQKDADFNASSDVEIELSALTLGITGTF